MSRNSAKRGVIPKSAPPLPSWNRFREFIAETADRFGLLRALIEESLLNYRIVTLGKNRHFFITPPPGEEGFLRRRPVILTAHYDRAQGSPGANDNSAAVFLLMDAAKNLRAGSAGNWVIIFTDKEELREGEGLQDQGSYTLALGLKDTGMENAHVFCFDACGSGETLIISTTADFLVRKRNQASLLQPALQELREKALAAARSLGIEKALLLPTPFSDDAGFLSAGVAAQTITMLPSGEANSLAQVVRKDPGFAEALLSRDVRNRKNLQLIPETWRTCNSPGDSHLRLTPRHHRLVIRFACKLCKG